MTTLAQISETQAQKATTANENFDALAYAGLFGRRAAGISGLTWAYYGGILYVAGVGTAIADGTVALTLNLTNYVEATTAGVVSANTVGFTAGRMPLYTVVCGATTISSYADQRSRNLVGDFTAKGNVTIGGTLGVTGTITAAAITASGQVQVTKTGNADAAGIYQNAAGQSTIAIRDSTQAVDAKLWDMSVGIVANALIFRTINDAISVASTWLSVLRAGTNITSVTFPNGSFLVSGAATLSSTLAVAIGGTSGIGVGVAATAAAMVAIKTTAASANHLQFIDSQASGRTWQIGPGAGDAVVTNFALFDNTGGGIVAQFSTVAGLTRYLKFSASNGGNPSISVSAGSLSVGSDLQGSTATFSGTVSLSAARAIGGGRTAATINAAANADITSGGGGNVAGLLIVQGSDGAGKDFCDYMVYRWFGNNPVAVQFASAGAPAARTYTINGGTGEVNLAMGAGGGPYVIRTITALPNG
jgi:hypothetical protein